MLHWLVVVYLNEWFFSNVGVELQHMPVEYHNLRALQCLFYFILQKILFQPKFYCLRMLTANLF